MTNCTNCQKQITAGSKFCTSCGTPVPAASVQATPASSTGSWLDAVGGHPDASGVPSAFDPDATVVRPPVAATPAAAEPATPASFGGVEPSGPTRSNTVTFAVVGGLVVVLAIVVVAFAFLRGGDGSDGSSDRFVSVPAQVEEQWEESTRNRAVFGGLDDDALFVGSFNDDGDEFDIESLDIDDGSARWAESVDGFDVSVSVVMDGVVVVRACDDRCEFVGLDASTGEELWSDDLDDGFVYEFNGRFYVEEFDSIAVHDIQTGDRLERVRSDFVSVQENGLIRVTDDDEIEVFDADLAPLYGPIEIDGDARNITAEADRVVFRVDETIEFVDRVGETTLESDVDADVVSFVLLGGDRIAAQTDDEVIVYDAIDGDAEEVWAEDGELIGVSPDGSALVVRDDQDFLVLEAGTGETRFDGDLDGGFTVSTRNALISWVSDERRSTLVAHRWSDGEELWDEDFDGRVVLEDGVIVETDDEDVRVYR